MKACLLWLAITAIPSPALSQTATRIDNFSTQPARGGVLTIFSATLRTPASVPVRGVTLDFQISDGSAWQSITDDLTVTSNITDSTGRASVALLPPDNIVPGTYSVRAVFSGNSTYDAASAETQLAIPQAKCNDEGTIFNCSGAWEAIRIATHRTSGPGLPLILVHGNGQEDDSNRANYFGWAALRNSILQSTAYAAFDVFIWKHDTARAIGFNGYTGNAADLANYVNNRLLPKYPANTKVVFIAHSRGGLVVRSFMNYQDQGNAVARLITLGTPHHGTPFAVPDWSALNWAANINTDASIFDRVYAFAFDVNRLGSLSLGWDNLDGAINEIVTLNWTSAIATDGQSVLTPADSNSPTVASDPTMFYSPSLKTAFGTLAELNQREKYFDKIVRYGAFDDSLSDNDELMRQSLSSLSNAFALTSDLHKALQVVTGFLAVSHVPLKTAARYFANDGLVPLQSALYLDISDAKVFSDVDNQRQVSLTRVSSVANCGTEGVEPLGASLYRVWSGSRDQIRDHLDLLQTGNACYWQAIALDVASTTVPTFTLQYGFPASAGTSATTTGDGAAKSGYVRIQAAFGSRAASGFAIYDLRLGGVLISETAVQAAPAVRRGRIYAENSSITRTAIAFANPNDQDVTISFLFTDKSGTDGKDGSFIVPARSQIARFLDEAPFSGGPFTGTFTFDAALPVGALALRGDSNERSEFLMTTLPVASLASPASLPVAIPQFADGGGWTTSVLLINPTDAPITGTAEFFSPGTSTAAGEPLTIVVNGRSDRIFSYNIPPRSSTALETAGAVQSTQSGWIKITPASGNAAPVSLAVFRFRVGSVLVSETGVAGSPNGSSFAVYVENSSGGPAAAIKSGLAVANPSTNPVVVTLDLSTLAGAPTGLTSTVVVPAQGQLARFLTEFSGFSSLPGPFEGILNIRSISGPISLIGLRAHVNERADFLIATTPPANNDLPASSEELVIPHFVNGGGYTTRFVLFSGSGAGSSGTMMFFDGKGQPAGLSFKF